MQGLELNHCEIYGIQVLRPKGVFRVIGCGLNYQPSVEMKWTGALQIYSAVVTNFFNDLLTSNEEIPPEISMR